ARVARVQNQFERSAERWRTFRRRDRTPSYAQPFDRRRGRARGGAAYGGRVDGAKPFASSGGGPWIQATAGRRIRCKFARRQIRQRRSPPAVLPRDARAAR